MKKILLILTVVSLLTVSCRVTKSLVMMTAKQGAEMTDEDFINKKLYGISFLKLTDEQEQKAVAIWKTEKDGLKAPVLKNENIAPVVYNSEVEFRKLLTEEQLKKYPVKTTNDYEETIPLFLNNRQMDEIKRIYLDK